MKMVHNLQLQKETQKTRMFGHTFSKCTYENLNAMETGETGI